MVRRIGVLLVLLLVVGKTGMKLQIKRVYDEPSPSDGTRVLVDRLWPRGVSKEDGRIDVWAKELAPSTELRRWFGHDDARFAEFSRRYQNELEGKSSAVDELMTQIDGDTATLIYAARNEQSNHAVVLKEWLEKRLTSR